MPYMVSTSTNYHWVKRIKAVSNTAGVLNLMFHGDEDATGEQFNMAEITVFTEDQALVDRLVAAINGCADTQADEREQEA